MEFLGQRRFEAFFLESKDLAQPVQKKGQNPDVLSKKHGILELPYIFIK